MILRRCQDWAADRVSGRRRTIFLVELPEIASGRGYLITEFIEEDSTFCLIGMAGAFPRIFLRPDFMSVSCNSIS